MSQQDPVWGIFWEHFLALAPHPPSLAAQWLKLWTLMRNHCLASLVIAVIRVSGSFSLNKVTLLELSRWTIHPAGQTKVLQPLNSKGRRDQTANCCLSQCLVKTLLKFSSSWKRLRHRWIHGPTGDLFCTKQLSLKGRGESTAQNTPNLLMGGGFTPSVGIRNKPRK